MSHRLRRFVESVRTAYYRYGIRGLYEATKSRINERALPIIYRNNFLRKMHRPKLQTVFLELTNNCNLRCKMCNWLERGKTGYISKSLFESCINQLSEIGIGALNLEFAGESLLHPNFKEFLKYAVHKRDQGKIGAVGWTDNGMLFNEDIANLVISLKVDWINISLDGVGQVNDNIRLGSKYSVIEKNIKYLLKNRRLAKKPKVLLNMVDTGKTENEKLEFYKEWIHLVDGIELIPSILPDNTWEKRNHIPKTIKTAPPPAFCKIPFDTMIISWDGKVTCCCFDCNLKFDLGDVNQEAIKQIWLGSKFQNIRKAVVTNTFPVDSPCYKCEFWKVNFETRDEPILDGKARIEYGGTTRKIRSISKKRCQ